MICRKWCSTRQPIKLATSLLVALFLIAVPYSHAKKDRTVPHGHRGKLRPYTPGPFQVTLTAAEEATLQSGQPVTKQTVPADPNAPGTVLCIQDVNAPVSAVWHQILGMDSYHKKVSKVTECRNYFVSKLSHGRVTLKTKQVLGVLPGYSFESYYDHTFHPAQSSLTWTLDYDKTSDLDDVAGHWHVEAVPLSGTTKPTGSSSRRSCSRVFYACDVQMKGVVPAPLLNYMSKTALRQATAWVKKESEAHSDLTVSTNYGGHMLPQQTKATTTASVPFKRGAKNNVESEAATTSHRRRFWGRK